MTNFNKACQLLEFMETTRPDTTTHSSDLADQLSFFELSAEEWSLLIQRYGGSVAEVVPAALAWILVRDDDKDAPVLGEEHVIRLAEAGATRHPIPLDLCLTAATQLVMKRKFRLPEQRDRDVLFDMVRAVLTRCDSFRFQSSLLLFMDALQRRGLLSKLLTSEQLKELRTGVMKFRNQIEDGPFGKMADRILRTIGNIRDVASENA